MPAAARRGDSLSTGHGCDGVSTLATPGQNKVFIQTRLAVRRTDKTVPHNIQVGISCVPHVASVNNGSSKVFIVGLAAARVGDSVDSGRITSGSSKVFIGG